MTFKKGSRRYKIIQCLYQTGDAVKREDLMIAAFSRSQVSKWKKNQHFGDPFGDGLFNLRNDGIVERVRHGYYELTDEGWRTCLALYENDESFLLGEKPKRKKKPTCDTCSNRNIRCRECTRSRYKPVVFKDWFKR